MTTTILDPQFTGTGTGVAAEFYNSALGTDEKISDIYADSSGVSFRFVNDAYSAASTYMFAQRGSGYTVASIEFLTSVTVNGGITIADRVYDIRSFGAACDGVTDDAPAIQAAVDAASAAGGGTISFPAGQIVWDSQVVLGAAAVHLVGAGWSEDVSSGTRIIINSSAATPLSVNTPSARGGSIRSMSFQQHQVAAADWTPNIYPFVIDIEGVDGQFTIDDIFCYNCYNFIRSVNSGRTTIGRLRGQPLNCGIYINGSYDTTHVADVHFWCYWTPDETNAADVAVVNWQQANADAIRLYRVDGFQASRIFAFGYRSAIHASYATTDSPDPIPFAGGLNLAQIGALYPDGCKYGIWMDGAQSTAHIDSIYTGDETLTGGIIPGGFPIYLNGEFCTLSIANAKLYYTEDFMIVLDQTAGGNVLLIGNLELNTFNQSGNNSQAIFCTNTEVPNIIRIANQPNVVNSTGVMINPCNAWFTCPGDTPQLVSSSAGSTVLVVPSQKQTFITLPASAASITIILPQTYEPNGEMQVWSNFDIVNVTWEAAGGSAAPVIVAPPTGLRGGQSQRFKFFSAAVPGENVNSWYFI